MTFNFLAILVAALISVLIGFVWYNSKIFGTVWMKEAGLTQKLNLPMSSNLPPRHRNSKNFHSVSKQEN